MKIKWMQDSSPEQMGVSSDRILNYLRRLEKEGFCLHGFCLIRHNRIISEGYCAPFHANRTHRMYSVSKSFVALAVGLLQDEGKIRLDDPICQYFQDSQPEEIHPWVREMTIRDMLRMATAFYTSPYEMTDNPEHDWIRMTFECAPTHRPGQVFSYDTSVATMLAALVEEQSGMELTQYLRDRLGPLELSPNMDCVKIPNGQSSWGGSGILCTQRDFAKLALLSLHHGEWEGTQLISREYMDLAVTKQIENGQDGYGYQFWMTQRGFAMKGMGGQMAYCLPKEDMVLMTTADMQSDSAKIGWAEMLFYDQIADESSDAPLPENPESWQKLKEYCREMKVLPKSGGLSSPVSGMISGKTYRMTQNEKGTWESLNLEMVRLDFDKDRGSLTWGIGGELYKLDFGLGYFIQQDFPGFASEEEVKGRSPIVYWYEGEKPAIHMPCIVSGAWQRDTVLELLCYTIGDFLGTLKIRLVFDRKNITVRMEKFAEKFWSQLQGFQTGTEELNE